MHDARTPPDRPFVAPATRLCLYLAASAATFGAATALGLAIMPDDLGHEFGPIQLCQGAVLVAAAAGLLRRLHADGLAHRLGPVWVTAALGACYLVWREIEIDKILFNLHVFSWRYLVRDVPIAHKIFFATVSIGSLAGFAWYLRRNWQRFVRGVRQRWPLLPAALGAAGMVTLVVAQLWDKSAFLQSIFSVSAFRSAKMEPVPEEMLELVAQLLLLCAVVELNVLAQHGHPALADATLDGVSSNRAALVPDERVTSRTTL
jgi:hypothetical protein